MQQTNLKLKNQKSFAHYTLDRYSDGVELKIQFFEFYGKTNCTP
jgi:hypothetical protein